MPVNVMQQRLSDKRHASALAKYEAEHEQNAMRDDYVKHRADELFPVLVRDEDSFHQCLSECAGLDELAALSKADQLDDSIEFHRLFRIVLYRYCNTQGERIAKREWNKRWGS